MAKRLTKEHLETDPLLTSYYLFMGFIKRNKAAVISVSLAFVLVVGGGLFYYLNSQRNEVRAQELLAGPEMLFEQGLYEAALLGDDTTGGAGLVDVINNYGRTRAGNLAHYYAAVAESELGNYTDALFYIERFDPPRGILGVGPIALHAVILSNLGELNQAGDIFVKAARWDENRSTTPQNLLNAAQAFIEAENFARANQVVSQIVSEYEDSEIIDQVRRLEGMLAVRQ